MRNTCSIKSSAKSRTERIEGISATFENDFCLAILNISRDYLVGQ